MKARINPNPPMDSRTWIVRDAALQLPPEAMCGAQPVEKVGGATLCAKHAEACKKIAVSQDVGLGLSSGLAFQDWATRRFGTRSPPGAPWTRPTPKRAARSSRWRRPFATSLTPCSTKPWRSRSPRQRGRGTASSGCWISWR